MIYLISLIISLITVSFLNTVIYRQSWKKSLLGRSKCEHCQHELKAKDLIPILGYILNRGKCAYCSKKISPFHFWTEIAFASFSLILVWQILHQKTPSYLTLSMTIFTFVSLYFFSIYDILYRKIPTLELTAMLIITLFYRLSAWQFEYLVNGLIILVFIILIIYFTAKIKKKKFNQVFGEGDILYIIWLALLFTLNQTLIILIISGLLGIIYFIPQILVQKKDLKKEENRTLPYLPFVSLAAYFILLNSGI